MAISKKEAKKVIAVLRSELEAVDTQSVQVLMVSLTDALMEADIKNKSFRKSIKRISKMLERPKKAAQKKVA